jgi:DNA polymerase delta subunit OB-fold domain
MQTVRYERACAGLDMSPASRFLLSADRAYTQQYFGFYRARFQALRSRVQEAALRAGWLESEFAPSVTALRKNKRYWVIGTLYRNMPLRPSILADLEREVLKSKSIFFFKFNLITRN